MDSTNGTSGYIEPTDSTEASVQTASKPRTKRAKALDDAKCVTCKVYGCDKSELDMKILDLLKEHNKNQVASMLRVHSQYIDKLIKGE